MGVLEVVLIIVSLVTAVRIAVLKSGYQKIRDTIYVYIFKLHVQ